MSEKSKHNPVGLLLAIIAGAVLLLAAGFIALQQGYLHNIKSIEITTSTGVDFLMVFRPGVYWNIGKKVGLNGEAKFGSLGGVLIVMPTVNLSILL